VWREIASLQWNDLKGSRQDAKSAKIEILGALCVELVQYGIVISRT
jgi:hypothetical protein